MKVVAKLMLSLCMMIFMTSNAFAQMAAAQRIVPVVEKNFTLKASVDEVWDYVMTPKNFMKISGVKSMDAEAFTQDATMKVVSKSGVERTQRVVYLSYEFYNLCFEVTESPYEPSHWVYAVQLKEKGKNCAVELIMNTGLDKSTPELKEAAEEELSAIQEGLQKKFK